MNIAVLASGRGSNLKAIIDAVHKGHIKADLKVVISDKKEAYALEHAKNAHIPAFHINPKDFIDRESFDRAVVAKLKEFEVDLVVLAGFMRLVSAYFVEQYPDKIINIHPSLLPAFKGAHAIRDAYTYGVKITGATVHYVVEEMDAGKILLQEAVPITPQDTVETLEDKIHQAEHRILPQAIAALVNKSNH